MGADLIIMLSILLATIILPGPDMMILARYSLSPDGKTAHYCNIGIMLGLTCHIFLALIGVTALMAAGGLFYQAAKIIGALYLVYMGYQSIRSGTMLKNPNNTKMYSYKTAFRHGFLTNLLNIKVMIFIFVLFTQVINPDYALYEKMIFVMVLLVAVWFFWTGFILLIRHPRVLKALKKHEKRLNMFFGTMLIVFGLLLAVSS